MDFQVYFSNSSSFAPLVTTPPRTTLTRSSRKRQAANHDFSGHTRIRVTIDIELEAEPII